MRAVVRRLAHGVGGWEVSQVHTVVVGGVVGVVGVRVTGVAAQRRRRHVGSLHLHLDQGGRLSDQGERVAADTVDTVRRRDGAPELAHTGGGSYHRTYGAVTMCGRTRTKYVWRATTSEQFHARNKE